MGNSFYFPCLEDSWTLSICTIRSFSTHEQFLQLYLIIACILIILISFSGISVIFRFDNCSYSCLFTFFYLFHTLWGKKCVLFSALPLQFLVSVLLFSNTRKDLWFCYWIFSALMVSFLNFFLYLNCFSVILLKFSSFLLQFP